MSASVRDAVERLLAESDDEDLGDLDLSAITLEDILREEEQQQQSAAGDASAATSFFSPATMTIATAASTTTTTGSTTTAPVPRGMEAVAKELSTEIAVGGNAALAAASAHAATAVTRSALEIAEAREKQLLSCVGVELVSPLQAKRRLRATARAKRQSSATQQQQQQQQQQKPPKKKKKTKLTLASSEAANNNNNNNSSSSSVVKVQAMDAISRQLQKNLEFKEHGPGSPTVVAIHSKFIAIGTSKGLVLIFDHFQNIRQVLGNTNDADSDGPVTAIDVSPGSDYLVCGYQSGRLVLWDMIKGTSLKAVSDAHEHPVVSLRFLKDQKPVLVSVDTNGVLNKINFSKMMGMVYVVDVDPIYDGSAGKLLSISILPQSAGNAKISHLTDQYVLAALSSEKVTFLIAIEPEVKVLYRWARPDDVGADDPVLPSLAFAWISFPGSSRALAPVLARGWGRHVQFLEVVFPGGQHHSHSKHGWPTFEEHDLRIETASDTTALQWLGDQVIVYLNAHDEICVYDVMSRQELEVVDVSLLELVFASYRGKSNARSFANSFRGCDNILYLLGLKELQTARVQPWTQRIDTLVDDGQWLEALALALDHYEGLKVAAADRAVRDRFPPVFFRDRNNDQCLVDLLHMSQTNQRTGEKEDVFRHEDSADEVRWRCGEELYAADVAQRLEETYQKARSGQVTKNFVPISVAERVADLLMEYVRLAIANAPTSTGGRSQSKLDLSKSHYQMLAGVCIEYCAIIGRTDLLFGEIFKRFQDAGKTDVFVELLEPYILSDKLRTLSPDVLEAFVSHYDRHDKLAQVEQCLLHLHVAELDTDTILSLCKKHELYSALVYIYNEAHQDFVTPIEILLDAMKNAPPPAPKPAPITTRAPSGSRVSSLAAAFGGTAAAASSSTKTLAKTDAEEDPEATARRRRQYGYKLLLYLSYSLSGRSFPKHEPLAPQLLSKVRADVLHHLFESSAPSRLSALIELDAKAFLHILARTFDDPTVEFDGEKKALEALRPTSRYDSARKAGIAKCPSRLSMVLALANVVFGGLAGRSDLSQSAFGSVEHGHFFMFEARLLSGGAIDAQEYADALGTTTPGSSDGVGSMMNSLMTFLALGPASLLRGDVAAQHPATQEDGFDKAGRETMLVRLLQKLHKDSYDHAALLRSVTQEGMHRAAVILHKERGDVAQAVAAYLADDDQEFRMNAFTYIRVETDKVMDEDAAADAADGSAAARRKIVEDALLAHAPALMETDDYAFVVLVLDKFPSLNNKVIQKFLSMGSKGGGAKLEFLYLKQILTAAGSGSSSSSGSSQNAAPLTRRGSTAGDVGDEGDMVKELLDRSKLRLADDPAVQERFVRLLCEFEPDGVFPYLESHDSYKVDACLKLCKDFGITDAEAYLLERTGDVTGALTLILHSMEQKLKILKPALRGYNLSAPSTSSSSATENGGNAATATGASSSASAATSAAASSAMARGRGPSNESIIESVPEGREAKKTLEVALAMCQRNSMRNRDDQAEKLWFTLLDKLLRIQNAVKRSLTSKASSSSRLRATPTVSSNVSASGAQTPFQVALNELIRIILERMASSVSLKSILFKITNEHGRGEFGDFRPTIFGMLDTYNYEQNIYQTANGLISADLFDQVVTLKRALSRAYAPPSEVCGYCKESLAKPPFGMAHSGTSGGERWNLHSSMVMIVSRQVFHESCAKAWQQQDVGNSIAAALSASNGPSSTGSSSGRRHGSVQRHASVSSMAGSERGERSGSITSNDASTADDESAKLQKKQPSTRRYLNRLKNARKTTRRPVALHIVLESLIREDTGRNKYLKSSRAMFSLRPDPEQTRRVKRSIGPRTPGSLPADAIHRGHI